MKHSSVLLSCLLLATTAAFAQAGRRPRGGREGQPDPAILSGIPTLGQLFRSRQPDRLWFPLESPRETGGDSEGEEALGPNFRERWLMRSLRARFKRLGKIRLVESRRTVFEDQLRPVSTESRGLEVLGSPSALKEAKAWLVKAQEGANRRLCIEMLFVRGEEFDLGKVKRPTPTLKLLDESSLASVLKPGGSHTIALFSVTTFDGQRAKAEVSNEVSYIKDYEVEASEAVSALVPIVDVVHDGITAEISALVEPESEQILVEAQVVLQHLKRPIRPFTVTVGKGMSGTIQLPEVTSMRWDSKSIVLKKGDAGFVVHDLVMILPEEGHQRARLVTLYCRITEEDPADAARASTGGVVVAVDPSGRTVAVRWPEGAAPIESGGFCRSAGDGEGARLQAASDPGPLQIFAVKRGRVRVGERVF